MSGSAEAGLVRLRCPCKINLGLEITGRRPDGYHTLRTLFVPLDFCDELTLEPAQTSTLVCNREDVPTGPENLVFKALAVFNTETSLSLAFKFQLEKRIPHGAGLGGGSGNAGTLLRYLFRQFAPAIPFEVQCRIAARVGADVPFFLRPVPSLGEGIGEILTELSGKLEYQVLVVFPRVHVSTVMVFKSLAGGLKNLEKTTTLSGSLGFGNLPADYSFANRLESPVFRMHPELKRIKQELLEEGAVFASMSGSGSALYGLFDSGTLLEKAFLRFQKAFFCFKTKLYTEDFGV